MKILTVFFSMKGETIAPGMKVVDLEKGHTNVAAEYIQQAVGGDLFEIETVKTYIADHMKMIYEAKEELEKGVRPELKAYPDNFDDYDTVFLGYPNWWNTLPMPVVSFLATGRGSASSRSTPARAAASARALHGCASCVRAPWWRMAWALSARGWTKVRQKSPRGQRRRSAVKT